MTGVQSTPTSFQWVRHDGGRASSKRPKQKNDCTVRALALARGLSYDTAYDVLRAAGRQCNGRFQFGDWLDQQTWTTRIGFPAVKGHSRMNPGAFVQQFPRGRYICRVARHCFTVVNGIVLDDTPVPSGRCIYVAWAVA